MKIRFQWDCNGPYFHGTCVQGENRKEDHGAYDILSRSDIDVEERDADGGEDTCVCMDKGSFCHGDKGTKGNCLTNTVLTCLKKGEKPSEKDSCDASEAHPWGGLVC